MIGDTEVSCLRAAIVALNAGDLAGYIGNFDPSCKRWVAGFDQPLSLDSVAGGFGVLSAAFDDLRVHEEAMFSDGRFVCARWRMTGKHVKSYMGVEPQGAEISVRNCEIYEFKDNKVVETWTYGDPADLFRQIHAAV